MGYTIRNFIESNKFPGGGELLLTSLIVYENLDERRMLSHLEELNKKQVSGFCVKRTQNTAHQNKLLEILLVFCREHSIPVIEIPQELSYWAVIKYLLLQIFNIEIAKAVYSKITRDEFNRIFSEDTSECRALEKLFDRAKKILGNPIALYDEDFHCIYSGASEEKELIIAEENEKYVHYMNCFKYV